MYLPSGGVFSDNIVVAEDVCRKLIFFHNHKFEGGVMYKKLLR